MGSTPTLTTMIHKKLSAKPSTHYGTGLNSSSMYVLLQLGDELDQVRVCLTIEEVDRLIKDLQRERESLLSKKSENIRR